MNKSLRISTVFLIALFGAGLAPLQAEQALYVYPRYLYLGSQTLELLVSATFDANGARVRWNGAERATEAGDYSQSYKVTLLPEDVATTGLSKLELFDPWSGRILATAWVPVLLDVKVKDLVFDAVRKRFFMTTSGATSDPRFPPYALVAMDSETGVVGPALQSGNGPGSLALSPDGSALYVSMDGSGVVRKVNPDSLEVVSEYPFRGDLGGSALTEYALSRVAVSPLNPSTFALFWHPDAKSSVTRLGVFDGSSQRPKVVDYVGEFDSILFAPDGNSVFLGNFRNFNTSTTTARYFIDPAGFTAQKPVGIPGGGPVALIGDLLYTSGGLIIDVRTNEVVSTLGVGGSVAVDPVHRRILAAHFARNPNAEDNPVYLQAFDIGTQEPLGWQQVGLDNYYDTLQNPAQRMFRFGEDGLLMTAGQGLLMFHTPLAARAPEIEADSVLDSSGMTTTQIVPGEVIAMTGTNLGPYEESLLEATARGRTEASLAGVRVWFGRTEGTVVLASSGRVEVVVPKNLQPGAKILLQLWNYGIPSQRVSLTVVAARERVLVSAGGVQ